MNKKRIALSFLALVLSLLLVLSMSAVSVFAETDTTVESEAATVVETETETETEAKAEETTGAAEETTTSAATEDGKKIDPKEAIINLSVGGVLLVALVVLCILFRKKIPTWFRSVKSECKKIVWCPKDQLKNSTIVVLITIIAVAVVIGLLDLAFMKGIQLLRDGIQALIK